MYEFLFRKGLEKKLLKLAKKNPHQLLIIEKRIKEIILNPHRYKNLRKPLQHWKRVHIDKHFVLTFSVRERTVIFEDYDHHDSIYK